MSKNEQRLHYAIYNTDGELLATAKYAEEAACIVSFEGTGSTVRDLRTDRLLWTEGKDGEAGESFDNAAEIMRERG